MAWQAYALLLVLTLGLKLMLELPSVRYNILELFAARSMLNIGLFSIALLWESEGPWYIARWAGVGARALPWLPMVLPLAAEVQPAPAALAGHPGEPGRHHRQHRPLSPRDDGDILE